MIYKNIPREDIQVNAWNPNYMEGDMWLSLKENIKLFGFNLPIVVRKLKKKYEIIDGEHRFMGIDDDIIPCIVLEKDDFEAKGLTIGLNNIRGDVQDLDKLKSIIKEVYEKYGRSKTKELMGGELSELINIKDTPDIELKSIIGKEEPIGILEEPVVRVNFKLAKDDKNKLFKVLDLFSGTLEDRIVKLCSEILIKL